MARSKLTLSITPTLEAAVRRVATIEDRSMSDMVEEALGHYFDRAHRDAEHHAIMARLQRLDRRFTGQEQAVDTLFELTCHLSRFAMSLAPEIPERDRIALHARGSERFRNVIAAVVARLGTGRSVWRDSFASTAKAPAPTSGGDDATQPAKEDDPGAAPPA